MVRVFLGLVLVPIGILIIWFMTPLTKDIMISVVEGWGAKAGLGGFALLLANLMPIIVPTICFAGIIACLIGMAKGRSSV